MRGTSEGRIAGVAKNRAMPNRFREKNCIELFFGDDSVMTQSKKSSPGIRAILHSLNN